MEALIATVFFTSLAGSLHCAGMCGGFVAFYAGADTSTGARRLLPHLAYHLGRLAVYATFGALAGGLGAAVDLAASGAGVPRAAMAAAGAIMVGWGAVTLGRLAGLRIPALPVPAVLTRASRAVGRRLAGKPPVARAALLGLATGLLPCGWLYAFVVTAAGTGSAWTGAAAMALFWAGTLPVLAALGAGVTSLLGPLRRRLPAFSAALVMAVGIYALAARPPLVAHAAQDDAAAPACHHHASDAASPAP